MYSQPKNWKINTYKTYLALGDSYTIGEGLGLFESFPYQLTHSLRQKGIFSAAPEIVAKTGWTSGELIQQLTHSELLPRYDLVTLLIGVNNQYRKMETTLYEREFLLLVKSAIQYAGGNAGSVYVLSIPDWGVTPFGIVHPHENISDEIDRYNQINQKLALENKTNYIDITGDSRDTSNDAAGYVKDQLHYSAKVYTRWTELLIKQILQQAR